MFIAFSFIALFAILYLGLVSGSPRSRAALNAKPLDAKQMNVLIDTMAKQIKQLNAVVAELQEKIGKL